MPTRCSRRRSALQKELKREMRARLKEDDSEPPQVDGPWAYYSRFRHGGQHRIYCRKPREGGAETVLIDGDARAEGKAFFQLAGARHSPDHSKFAWSSDELGSEIFAIAVRDIERGEDLADRVVSATGDVVWTRDSQRAFSMSSRTRAIVRAASCCIGSGTAQSRRRRDLSRRPIRPGSSHIEPTRLGRSAMIIVHGHDASETHVVDLDSSDRKPLDRRAAAAGPPLRGDGSRRRLLYPHQRRGARFQDRRRATRGAGRGRTGATSSPHRDGRFIADATLFKDHLVVLVREESRPRLSVYDLKSGEAHEIAFEEETYSLGFEPVYEFDDGASPLQLFVDGPAGGDLRLRLR